MSDDPYFPTQFINNVSEMQFYDETTGEHVIVPVRPFEEDQPCIVVQWDERGFWLADMKGAE